MGCTFVLKYSKSRDDDEETGCCASSATNGTKAMMDIKAVLLNQLLLTFVIYHGPRRNGACQMNFCTCFVQDPQSVGIVESKEILRNVLDLIELRRKSNRRTQNQLRDCGARWSFRRCHRHHGQTNNELAALARACTSRLDSSKVQKHEFLNDCQPNAESPVQLGGRPVTLFEKLKDARKHVRVDAIAIISNSQHRIISIRLDANDNLSAGRRELGRIEDEILDDLLNPSHVSENRHRAFRKIGGEIQVLICQNDAQGINTSPGDSDQVRVFLVQLNLPMSNSADVQQIFEQASHMLDLALHDLAAPLDHGWVVLAGTDDPNCGPNRRQWIPEFMGEHRQEFLSAWVCFDHVSTMNPSSSRNSGHPRVYQ